MTRVSLTLILVIGADLCSAQNIGINVNGAAPNASALLDIDVSALVGPKRGLLIPRVTTTERLGIVAPATGLLVFDTSFLEFWFFDGLVWTPLSNGRGWRITGNAGTTAGTHFIGTTDAARLDFRVQDEPSGRIDQSTLNTFFGFRSGALSTTANNNTFFGAFSGEQSTTANRNTAVGAESARSLTSGYGNVAMGTESLFSTTTGARNVAVGQSALYDNTIGEYNSALGTSALGNNTTGTGNTVVGAGACGQNVTGNNHVVVGRQAGPVWPALQNTTCIGTQSYTYANNAIAAGHLSQAEGTNSIALGYLANATGSNSTAIGQNALALAPNSLVLGGTGANAVNVGIGVTSPTSTLEVNGYTKLGSDAPAIRTKKIVVNTPATQGAVLWIPHGLTGTKILSVQMMVEYVPGQFVPDNYNVSGYYLRWYVAGANISVETVAASSANILNKQMKVFITYEQ